MVYVGNNTKISNMIHEFAYLEKVWAIVEKSIWLAFSPLTTKNGTVRRANNTTTKTASAQAVKTFIILFII